MSKRVVFGLVLALSMVLTWAGCAPSAPPPGAQLRVRLTTPAQRFMTKDADFRINVDLADAAGKPLTIKGLKVMAEVQDAHNVSLGKFACKLVAAIPGRYQSEIFRVPEKAVEGKWTTTATAGQGPNAVLGSHAVVVTVPLKVQISGLYDYELPIPSTWDIYDQQSSAEAGSLVLNPIPGNNQEKALMEVRYVHGEVGVNEEAVRQFLLQYNPTWTERGSAQVTSLVETHVQGHKAWLARGTFVTDRGQDEKGNPLGDDNFSVQVLRFYCDAPNAERTFTIIAASTSDVVMSQMLAKLDEFRCHGLGK